MKWISRKFLLVVLAHVYFGGVPVLFMKMGVANEVTMLSLGTVAAIVMWYLKVNRDLKPIPEVVIGSD
jgi:hypothetical protein